MPPRRQPGRQANQNLTGLGLLGAAPAELQQGYGGGAGMGQGSQQGFGGGGGMGQYGTGPRSLMGNNSQFQGNTGQMGGGARGQHGRGKPGTAAPTRGRGRGRAKPSPTVNTQRGSLLPDPTSEQTDQGYGIEQHNPGNRVQRGRNGRPGSASRGRGRNPNTQSRALLPDPTPFQEQGYGTELEYPGEVAASALHKRPPSARGRRAVPAHAPNYAQETEHYGEEQNYDQWPSTDNKGTGLLGDAPQEYAEEAGYYQEEQYGEQWPQYDETQGYQEGYTEAWPAAQHKESQGYYENQHARALPAGAKRKKPLLGETPQYDETQAQYGGEAETWSQTEQKPSLLGEAPQSYEQEAYGQQWSQESQEYQEGYQGNEEAYGETWDQTASTGEGYSGARSAAGYKTESLLGEGPQYETENYQDAQYADTWPVADSKQGILGDAPAAEYSEGQYPEGRPRPDSKRGLLGQAPGYGAEAQPARAKRKKPLLGESPAYGGGTQGYTEEQYAETKPGLLGEAPAYAYGEGANEYQEQYADTWPQSEKSKGLLGDAPVTDEGQAYEENPYPVPRPHSDGKKGLLGDAPGHDTEALAGENRSRRGPHGRQGDTNYPDKKKSKGMRGILKGGTQQRSDMGMGQMGMRNQMGDMGRPSSQAGSDQYRMGDMDNRRNSGGLLGSGQYNDGQGYRETERSSGQQPRSLLGPRPLLEDNRASDRERALAQRERLLAEQERVLARQAEEKRMIMLREEEMRLQQQQEEQLRLQREQQMRVQREEQLREEQLRAEQMRAVQIMQQEQQRMRPMQQQQQRRMGKSDGLLGEAPGSVRPGGAGQGGIPSLLDYPGGNRLGKRPGDRVNRPGDKRPRREPSPDRRRGPNRPDNRRDQQNRRQQDRSSDRSKPRTDQSPQKKDQGDAGRRSGGSRHDNRKDNKTKDNKKETSSKDKKDSKADDKAKDTKGVKQDAKSGRTVNTKITVTIDGDTSGDKYDPANPTTEDSTEDVGTADELKMDEDELNKLMGDDGKDDDVMIVGEEKMDVDKDGKMAESNLTVTVTKHKKGRSVNDADGKPKKEQQKPQYHCNVCNVGCFSEKSFQNHLTGQKHRNKMETVMSVSEKKSKEIAARLQVESHIKNVEGRKQADKKGSDKGSPGKAMESHCRTCDRKFTGAYKDHKETPEHKERESLRRAGCKLCSIPSFSNYNIYCAHLESDLHKKKSVPQCYICKQWFKSPRKFVQHCKTDHHIENKQQRGSGKEDESSTVDEMSELVTLDVIGFDDDVSQGSEETIISQGEKSKSTTMNLEPLTPMLSKAGATSTPKQPGKFVIPEKIVVPDKHNPDTAVGQDYVIPVSGYFCKLCHKFYNNIQAAKSTHCQSKAHFDKYKNAMIVKAAKQSKEKSVGAVSIEVTVTESKNNDQSIDTTKIPDQSAVMETNQSAVTEASNYETADEQQDSTIQKMAESEQETVDLTDRDLVNGNTSKMSLDESKDTATDDKNTDSQEKEETGTVDLTEDDKESGNVVEVVGKGRGTPTGRGAPARNKARRAKKI